VTGSRPVAWIGFDDNHPGTVAIDDGAGLGDRMAVDGIDVVAVVFGHDQISPRSGHAYGRIDSGKRTWIGGEKDCCQRQ